MKDLSTIILCFIIGALACTIISIHNNASKQCQLIKAYEQYYNGSERLLDELDSAYNWVDGYDSYEYYSSKARIDSLTNNIQ